MSLTKLEFLKRVAQRWGYWHDGFGTSWTLSSCVDAELIEPDTFWVGRYITVTMDDGSQQERAITQYDQASSTVAFTPPLTPIPTTYRQIYIIPFRMNDFDEAQDAAVKAARLRWATPSVDTTVVITADTYEYDLDDLLSLNYTDIRAVYTRVDATHPWSLIDPAKWYTTGTPRMVILHFRDISDLTAGCYLRIDGHIAFADWLEHVLTDSLSLMAGTGMGDEDVWTFLVEYTLYVLHDMMANRNVGGGTFRAHLTQAQNYLQSAMRTMQMSRRYEIPGHVHKAERSVSRG